MARLEVYIVKNKYFDSGMGWNVCNAYEFYYRELQ